MGTPPFYISIIPYKCLYFYTYKLILAPNSWLKVTRVRSLAIQFKSGSSICWIAKSRIFLTSTSHIVFLSSSRSSICWFIFWTKNSMKFRTRMLEKNTRTTLLLHQRPSCLVLFDSGAFSFFSVSSMLPLFLLAFSFLLAVLLSFHLK